MGMLDAEGLREARRRYLELVERKAGFVLSQNERDGIQVVVFRDYSYSAVAAIDLVMHARYGARLIIWLPNQMMVEHWHPDADGNPGKEETFRVLWGTVHAYRRGVPSAGATARIPGGDEHAFTSRHEVVLNAGEQWTLEPHERHWFVAGPDGAVALEVSSTVRDSYDGLTDTALEFYRQ
jgi:D-lyxose ketol-isomerase